MQTGLTSSPLKWSGKRIWSDLSSSLQLCYSAWRVLTWAKKTQWAPDFGPRSSLVTNFQENHFCPPQSSSAPQTRGPNSQDSWLGDADTCHYQNISISTEMIKNRKNLRKAVHTPFPTIPLKLKIQGLNFWLLQWCSPGCQVFNHACYIRATEDLGFWFPACLTCDDGAAGWKDKNNWLFPSGLWFS